MSVIFDGYPNVPTDLNSCYMPVMGKRSYVTQGLSHMYFYASFLPVSFCSTSLHQRCILKALLFLKDPAEGGTCDNRGDPVRKWLFKSVHQLTCLPNEETCCYWWQQNYSGVISGRDIFSGKLIDQKLLIYTELTLPTRGLWQDEQRRSDSYCWLINISPCCWQWNM